MLILSIMIEKNNRAVSDIHKIINSYFTNYDYLQAETKNNINN